MGFNPDEYLKEKETGFNPDAYLAEFDPDAYLAETEPPPKPGLIRRAATDLGTGLSDTGEALGKGVLSSFADLWHTGANVSGLLGKVAGVNARINPATQGAEDIYSQIGNYMSGQAEAVAPKEPPRMAAYSPTMAKIYEGVGAAPGAIAKYTLGGAAGPVGMGAMDALSAADQGPAAAGEAFLKGVMFGKALHGVSGYNMPTRVASTGAYGSAQAAAEGGDVSDIVSSGVTLGGLGAMGPSEGAQHPFIEKIGQTIAESRAGAPAAIEARAAAKEQAIREGVLDQKAQIEREYLFGREAEGTPPQAATMAAEPYVEPVRRYVRPAPAPAIRLPADLSGGPSGPTIAPAAPTDPFFAQPWKRALPAQTETSYNMGKEAELAKVVEGVGNVLREVGRASRVQTGEPEGIGGVRVPLEPERLVPPATPEGRVGAEAGFFGGVRQEPAGNLAENGRVPVKEIPHTPKFLETQFGLVADAQKLGGFAEADIAKFLDNTKYDGQKYAEITNAYMNGDLTREVATRQMRDAVVDYRKGTQITEFKQGDKVFFQSAKGKTKAGTIDRVLGSFFKTLKSEKGATAIEMFPGAKTLLERERFKPQGRPLPKEQAALDKAERVFSPAEKAGFFTKERTRDFFRKAQTELTSEYAPLTHLERDVYAQAGIKKPALELGRKFEQIAGAAGKTQADVIEFQKSVIDPISRIADDFQKYLFLKRTESRLRTDPEAKKVANWTLDETRAGLDGLRRKLGAENYKLVEKQAKAYQSQMDKALRLQVDSGRMSEELYKAIKESNDFYAPFKVMKYMEDFEGIAGTGKKIATTQDLTKKITGISSEDFKLGNMLQASAENIVKSRILAEKNLKMQELGKVAAVDKNGEAIKVLEEGEAPAQGFEKVAYLENGEKKYMAVNKEVAKAIEGLNKTQAGIMSKAAALAAQPFRWGATGANAGFQVVNLWFADLPRQALISKYGIKKPSDLIRFPSDWIYSLYSSMTGNFGKPNKLYMDFLKSGAANSTIQRELTPSAFKETLNIKGKKTWGERGARFLKTPKTVILDNVAKFSNAVEETTKLLGFKRGMRIEGLDKMTPEQAREKLAEIVTEVRNFSGSPDFARHGNLTKQGNLLFMFLNARVQGAASDFARLAGRTGRKEATTAWARLATVVGLPTLALAMQNFSDENMKDYYEVPDEERKRYWMIPRYEENGQPKYFEDDEGRKIRDYYRIPKRETAQLFANLIEASVEFAHKKDAAALGKYAVDFFENISPINISGENMQERTESVIGSMNPILKAPVEYATNRNMFFHQNVVPERLKNASPYLQSKGTTPEIFKKVGDLFTTTDEAGKKKGGLSPLKLEQLVGSLTGGGLTQFTVGKPEKGRPAYVKYPAAKRFFRSGVVNQQADEKEIQAAVTEQADERTIVFQKAKDFIEGIDTLKPEEKSARFEKLLQADEPVFDKALEMLEDKQKGVSWIETQIKQLGVENGARTQFILKKIAPMTPEQKFEYISDLYKKKIVSEKVLDQIIEAGGQA